MYCCYNHKRWTSSSPPEGYRWDCSQGYGYLKLICRAARELWCAVWGRYYSPGENNCCSLNPEGCMWSQQHQMVTSVVETEHIDLLVPLSMLHVYLKRVSVLQICYSHIWLRPEGYICNSTFNDNLKMNWLNCVLYFPYLPVNSYTSTSQSVRVWLSPGR